MGRQWTSDKAWAAIPDHIKAGSMQQVIAWAFVDAWRQGSDGFTDFELADYLGANKDHVTRLRLRLIACDGTCHSCGRPYGRNDCDHAPGDNHTGIPAILENSGVTRPSGSGHDAIVWRLNARGLAYAERHWREVLGVAFRREEN